MKKILTLVFLTIMTLSCKAQSPIINIDGWDGEGIENTYYKDINNYFNVFEGTWLYTEATTSFKIVLEKGEMVANDIVYYQDDIFGEYQYIKDGVERINTLDNTDVGKVAIAGDTLLKSIHRPICDDCPILERRLSARINDKIANITSSLTIRAIEVGDQDALEIFIYGGRKDIDADNLPVYTQTILPTGTFIFIKQ